MLLETMSTAKTVYAVFMLTLFSLESIALGVDYWRVAIIVSSAILGAVTLNYFRPIPTWWERFLKTIISAAVSLIFGTAICEYFAVTSTQYVGTVYFGISFVSIALLRATLTATEANADGIVSTILIKFFRPTEKEKRSDGKPDVSLKITSEVKQ